MPHPALPIANEFDSYMQDRAQRLGYRVMFHPIGAACTLPASGRLALVECTASLRDAAPCPDFGAHAGLAAHHDRGHFIAWAGEPGALVQVNVKRREAGGDHDGAGRVGVRTFAEEFFGDGDQRSLPLADFTAYLAWLAAEAAPCLLALAARLPETRQLILARAPSAQAALAWLRPA
jgi:hypothetical protein